ncbi:Cytidine deaminase [uncultured Roseburia sp.]|uniref:Cytidine deaminase n=1 Tax=Brotonthovivens ammoniilytica TaxID=2981725 RepID=A0ABT2TG64_9FIRM|nr:cytidine deaminase [Brotonthovivens ammoniilytica]MCU6761136.1 cytidine deaminase [Brotonthovivens ammoniilytica]SCI19958.1 Cytidine deaminase [uncultured Roseburia sp.]
MIDFGQLVQMAQMVKEKAYAPYSGFRVGAALLGKSGMIYTGCNIENAAYPVTNCAERTALFKAVSEGEQEFLALAVVSDSADYVSPCGVCRQALAEFCGTDFQILMCRSNGDYKIMTLGELLPESFGF